MSQRINLFDVLGFPLEVSVGLFLNDVLLLSSVGIVLYTALVGEGIMHGELLLQLLDLLLHTFKEEFRVLLDVDYCLVADFHHAGGEFEGGNRFLVLLRLGIDVGNHDGLAVASDGVLEEVCELALTVRDVVTFVVAHTYYNLLQESQ